MRSRRAAHLSRSTPGRNPPLPDVVKRPLPGFPARFCRAKDCRNTFSMTDVSVLPFSAAILLASAKSESFRRMLVLLMHQSICVKHQYVNVGVPQPKRQRGE